jgi:hypothetical protein
MTKAELGPGGFSGAVGGLNRVPSQHESKHGQRQQKALISPRVKARAADERRAARLRVHQRLNLFELLTFEFFPLSE